jgi:hypothetical protein
MVAVRMVSEGVDIPRLAVGVYATSVGTALFFAQAVGRFVRARRDTADDLGSGPFQALEASAHFDRVLYDGNEFGVTAEEEDFLGLPGLLEPEQVALLLRDRKSAQLRKAAKARPEQAAAARPRPDSTGVQGTDPGPTAREVLATLRKELNGLVAAWHHRTGQPHGAIHAELRRSCGGPPLAQATAEQIRLRIAMMQRMAKTGR